MEISIKSLVYILVEKIVCFLARPREDHPGRGKDCSSAVFSKAEGRSSSVFQMAAVITIQPGVTGGAYKLQAEGEAQRLASQAGKIAFFNR